MASRLSSQALESGSLGIHPSSVTSDTGEKVLNFSMSLFPALENGVNNST